VLTTKNGVNNGMIEDGPDEPTGSLIDWEHTIHITKSNEYDVHQQVDKISEST